MPVVHTLPEHARARQQPEVGVMVPGRVPMAATIFFMPKLLKRCSVSFNFQKIDDAAAYYWVDEALNHCALLLAAGDDVKMIRHDDISQDQETTRSSGFI